MPNPAGTFNITYRTLSAGPLTNAQVDANFQALQDYALHLSGGTLTGALFGTTATFSGVVSGATPTGSTHLTTKAYVDANFLPTGSAAITNAHVAPAAGIVYSKLSLAGSIVDADVATGAAIAYSKLSLAGSIVDADVATGAAIAKSKLNLLNGIVNADVNTAAAIAYSKLNLTGGIVNADVATAAAIAYSKLNLAGQIVNADIASAAAIAYSKLNLSGSIMNADINVSAAIADTKLATISTAGKVANSATTATSAATANAIVARDSQGSFLATSATFNNSLGVGTAASGTAGEIRATNEITAYYASDLMLKENVRQLESALERLHRIRGVEFDWRNEYIQERGGEDGYFVRKHDIGLIAQEIENIMPEAVARRPDGNLAVRYEKVIPLLVEAVKELSAKVA